MKITIDFDATPDEARRFLGLPEVAPLQDALMAEIARRMRANLDAMDPETMWRQWMPTGSGSSVDAMRQMWEQAMHTAMGKPTKPE